MPTGGDIMELGANNLRPDMTIGELPCEDGHVTPETRGQVVFELFNARPGIPGVIIAQDDSILGVISRARFMEQMARPFGIDIYLHRPVQLLLKAIGREPLVLSHTLSIGDAARAALNRPTESVFEPIAVECAAGAARRSFWQLLDVHTLLLAQSGLLQLANEAVERQREIAESANRAKSWFLANMSHEIRTPLTAILGFAENLLDPGQSESDRRHAVKTVVRNGEHLLEIINDILDLSKIEAGKLDVERLSFSPARVVADVVSVMRVRADARRLPLRLVWQTPIPQTIQSDPTRLRQILINLLGNAIKFTERGSVELRVALDECGDAPARLVFSVADTGIGMTEAQLARLFQPFSQADQSTTRRFGGTGLGLAISRRLAELLDGAISVESRLGEGTTFHAAIATGSLDGVRLLDNPNEETDHDAAPAAAELERIDARILLAEDSPDNQLLISTFLRKAGADVEIAGNGQLACDASLAARDSGRSFDVILMDMQMPVLDGYEATRQLRSAGYTGAIIAITANAMRGDQIPCLEAGCNDYASKPINRRQLLAQIARLVALQRGVSHEPLSSNTGDRAVNGPPIEAITTVAVDARGSEPSMDYAVALERAGDDPDLVRDLCGILLETGPAWMDQLEQSLSTQDLRTARRLAHSLKSAAENLGGRALAEAAAVLEAHARDGRLAELAPAHETVAVEWRRLRPLVEANCRVENP